MTHIILAKFKSEISKEQKTSFLPQIRSIFDQLIGFHEITSVTVSSNMIDRENRYDVMIEIEMPQDTLPFYDTSLPHLEWKNKFSQYLEKKAIFDKP